MAWNPSTAEHFQKEGIRSELAIHDAPTSWTAARCQRLLRPLSSKIGLLRKEKQCKPRAGDWESAHECTTSPASDSQARVAEQGSRRRTVGTGDIADEEWAPNPRPRKKLKRTYSSKKFTIQQSASSSQTCDTNQDRPAYSPAAITVPSDLFRPEAEPITENGLSEFLQHGGSVLEDGPREKVPNNCNHGEHGRLPLASTPRSRYSVRLPFERRLTDGIRNGLDALLKSTRDQKSAPLRVRGSRGLFATCLRKVPDVIARGEAWNKMEDPESNVDVSFNLYGDLESLSTSTSGGWMPLRQIVRAHGVNMVGNAICEGLIGFDGARRIITELCLARAYDEAQHMLQCLMQTMVALQSPPKPLVETGAILQCLKLYVLATGRQSFYYRQLIWLLNSRRLPLEWIGRPDMIETWNKIVQSISQNDEHAGPATKLLRLVTSMTYGRCYQSPAILIHGLRLRRQGLAKEANAYMVGLGCRTRWPKGLQLALHDEEHKVHTEKASSTVSSLMTVLCAIGLLRSAGQAPSSSSLETTGMTALQDIAIDAQQMLELASDRVLPMPGGSMISPLLAAGLVQATLCRNQQTFASTVPILFDRLSRLKKDDETIEEGGLFLCAVADCCARATGDEVFEHTQKMVQHVRHIADSLKSISTSGELCHRMALAAAFEFADTTKHPKHLHWALDVEQAVLGSHLEPTRRTPVKTPLRGQARPKDGYRWEAGICEWVAKTPAIAFARASALTQRAGPPRSFNESPCRIRRHGSEKSTVSSPSSSRHGSKVSRPAFVVDEAIKPRIDEARDSSHNSDCLPKTSIFSHIGISLDRDELSDCGSSQESQPQPPPRLQEVANFAIKCKRNPATDDLRMVKGTCWSPEPTSCTTDTAGLAEVHDLALESEDELSFL
ncbi:MAG: hypothetical protein Q9169_002430 [Polycauliona sp. 2 TL-2023]